MELSSRKVVNVTEPKALTEAEVEMVALGVVEPNALAIWPSCVCMVWIA